MDIVTALSAAAQAVSLVKELRELDQGLQSAAVKAKMATLYSDLADIKMALVDARSELAAKNDRISELLKTFEIQKSLVESESGFRFLKNEDGSKSEYAVCPRCETIDGRIIQVVRVTNEKLKQDETVCPQCKSRYDLQDTCS